MSCDTSQSAVSLGETNGLCLDCGLGIILGCVFKPWKLGFVVRLLHETLVPDFISQFFLETVEERLELDGALVAISALLTQLIFSSLIAPGAWLCYLGL